ncbi:unnamed protein product [Thelazia callipaeda]|uniref:ABC transmembrane type-1 domain-containing protein n=1 Tax=Thelazia callipaeda TaxID=103827 RepID=A0A0N5D7F7_THECL|nr:unnamed protein product [Thelazia callipaeda]
MARKTQVTKLYCKVKPKPGLSLRIVSVLVESPLLDWTNAFHDYMSFYNLKYVTLVGILVAGITAWLVTISATVGTLSTITVGNAWHLMTCFMMDSMTQMHVGAAGRLVITQRSTSCVSVVA